MIAVLHAPRRGGARYIDRVFADVGDVARDERVMVCDGTTIVAPPGWLAVQAHRPCSQPQNKWAAFDAIGIAAELGARLLLLEDDVAWCRNGVARAHALEVPGDVAWVSFLANWVSPLAPPGLIRAPAAGFQLAQALLFPSRTVAALAAFRRSRRWDEIAVGGIDEVLGLIAAPTAAGGLGGADGWRQAVFVPGLVQHDGEVSAVGNGALGPTRTAPNYVGDHVDALTMGQDSARYR